MKKHLYTLLICFSLLSLLLACGSAEEGNSTTNTTSKTTTKTTSNADKSATKSANLKRNETATAKPSANKNTDKFAKEQEAFNKGSRAIKRSPKADENLANLAKNPKYGAKIVGMQAKNLARNYCKCKDLKDKAKQETCRKESKDRVDKVLKNFDKAQRGDFRTQYNKLIKGC